MTTLSAKAKAIQEQTLNLIYTALDAGEYQAAQSICQKPDIANLPIALALSSYALACQRKIEPALQIARRVAQSKPIEEAVVNALGCTFKSCRADKDFAQCYEVAINAESPANIYPDHFFTELFNCYGRLREFKKMQQIAQKLYKKHSNKTKFLFWIVGSTLLQPETPSAMITVSEKMLAKVYHTMDTSKGPGAEELELYVTTLVMQRKYQEAINEVTAISSRNNTATATRLEDDDHFHEHTDKVQQMPQQLYFLTLDLLFMIGDLPLLCSKAEELIVRVLPDQWNAWELLTHITLASIPGVSMMTFLHATSASKESFTGLPCFSVFRSDNIIPSSIPANSRSVTEHLLFIHQIQTTHPKLRGPYLAKLRFVSELIIHIVTHKPSASALLSSFLTICEATVFSNQVLSSHLCETVMAQYGEIIGTAALYLLALLYTYCKQFHSKYCCFSDLKSTLYALRKCDFACVVHSSLVQLLQVEMMDLYHELISIPLPQTSVKEEITAVIDLTKDDNSNMDEQVVVTAAGAVSAINEGILEGMVEGVINNLNLTTEDEDDDEDDEEEEGNVTTTNTKKNKKNRKKSSNKKANKKGGSKKHSNKNKHHTTKADEKAAGDSTAAAAAATTVDKQPAVPKATHQVNVSELNQIISKDESLLIKLCSFSQLLEVITCCQFLSTTAATHQAQRPVLSVVELILFFTHVSQLFIDGVGGEQRTIRPADTVLLTIASLIRIQLQTRFFTPTLKTDFITAFQYVALLTFALEKSPFSYAIKVDLMEGLRAICSAHDAFNIYENFGVKYIQHDSLSYLIMPCLMENGLLKEAASRQRQVVHAHKNSRREASEMLTHAFEFGNYIKAMQINDFVHNSRNSLILSLANVEGRVMDMICNPLTDLNDFAEFFTLIGQDNHDDIFQAFADVHVDKLVHHWEYDLIERLETLPVHMASTAAIQREQALQFRLLQPTFMIQFTNKLMKNDLNFPNHIAYPSHTTTGTAVEDHQQYERFLQSVEGDEPFAMIQGELMTQMAGLAIQFMFRCNHLASASPNTATEAPVVGSITALHNTFSHIFTALDEYARLLLLSASEEVRYTEELILPQPVVIRRIWAFTRGPSMWISCLLLILIQRCQKQTSLKKYQQLLESLAEELSGVTTAPEEVKIEDVQEILQAFTSSTTSDSSASVSAVAAEEEPATESSSDNKEEEMVKLLLAVIRRWAVLMGKVTRAIAGMQINIYHRDKITAMEHLLGQEDLFLSTTPSASMEQVKNMMQPYVERVVRSAMESQRENLDKASTWIHRRLQAVRTSLFAR